SEAFRARLSRDGDGRLVATTKSTDYTEVMNNAVLSETRRRMMHAYLNRGGQANVDLLESAIAVRREIATLMGFDTWADYRTQDRMAGNSANVLEFLTDLRTQLAPRSQADLQKLLAFKKERYQPEATQLDAWDINFLAYQLKQRDFELDDDEIRQ